MRKKQKQMSFHQVSLVKFDVFRHVNTLNLTASILPRFPCHWKSTEWQVAKIETEKLLAATVHNELENRRSSGFLGILVKPCGISESNNWTCKSTGKEC